MKIYIAGPISGMSYDEVSSYFRDTKITLEEAGFTVVSPMTGKKELRTELEFRKEGYDNVPVATNHAIYNRDRWMVTQSDIIYANLMNCGDRVSIGTCMELAWAFDKGKHVVIAMDKENIHRHAFVLESAHIVFESHNDAIKYLFNLQNGQL